VDLLVPVKPLHLAKSRLRTAGLLDGDQHRALALALVRDTIAAARSARGVRRLLAICSDADAVDVLRADGTEVIPDEPDAGLNPALRHGARLLRADDPRAPVGALQSDLPSLRAAELDAALTGFATLAGAARAFCPDRAGTGTTLLLAAPGADLDPRFGPGSAAAHTASGAHRLEGPWSTLRCDVDTPADLTAATRLGLGPRTTAALRRAAAPRARQ
jgi:2-phospho-L-lactate/phosphoenolpyruvate guanylyltransferase